jgi:tetratricopeptide (TPR) repeat protein
MSEESAHSLIMLYCYASEDRQWIEEIELHLSKLKGQYSLISRFDGELVSSTEQKDLLLARFEDSDLVLLLLSGHFKQVAAFWDELGHASWKLQWLGGCRVIVLMLEPIDWNDVPFTAREIIPRSAKPSIEWQDPGTVDSLKVFPADIRPLMDWHNRELAFQQIEQEIRIAIEKHWLARGNYLRDYIDDDDEALVAYEEALRLNPSVRDSWYGKAHVLSELKRYHEALHAYDEALRIDPRYYWAWFNKGQTLACLKRYEEALHAYDEALHTSDVNLELQAVLSYLWRAKGAAFASLRRYKEALAAYGEAIRLAPFTFHRDLVLKDKAQVLKAMKQEVREE